MNLVISDVFLRVWLGVIKIGLIFMDGSLLNGLNVLEVKWILDVLRDVDVCVFILSIDKDVDWKYWGSVVEYD